jgi:hypothetical protein
MNWFADIRRTFSPTCKEAIRLQSDALDRPLSRGERIGLWLHLRLCVWCLRYGRQLKYLRLAAQCCEEEHLPAPPMPRAVRERIKQRLRADKK